MQGPAILKRKEMPTINNSKSRDGPLVYVCSSFRGDTRNNIKKAKSYSRFVVDHGAIPLTPHLLLPQFMDEATERELAMEMDLFFLSKCDQLWAFGTERSDGMKAEMAEAKRLGIPIIFMEE